MLELGTRRGESTRDIVQQVNAEAHPRTVRELVELVLKAHPEISMNDILAEIRELATAEQIHLSPRRIEGFKYFWTDLHWNVDFWIVVLVSFASFVSLLAAAAFPWSLLRLVLIVPLFLYLPGRSLLRIISPQAGSTLLERVLVEFATSIVLVLIVGLVLNYSGLGFFAGPSVTLMIFVNLVLGFAASYQYYSILRTS